jgi:hypothetical protein
MAIVPSGLFRFAALGATLALGVATAGPSHAQGRVDARYTVTLAGIPLGKGTWAIDISDKQFTAAASGATAGLMLIFSSGTGSGASRGAMVAGKPSAATFASNVTTERKTEEIRMNLVNGNVKDVTVTPPQPPHDERVPVTEAHRNGVSDPMTASLIRVPGNGDVVRPEACPKVVSVFDGRMRFDLVFTYKRTENVKAEKGYEGPAVVCGVQFVPIAGHVPTRTAIKYLAERRDIEAWLVPVASTRVMVPFKVSIPTALGRGILQATQFVTSAQKPRTTTASPKTQ